MRVEKLENGTLPHAGYGCSQIIYVVKGEVYCGDCAGRLYEEGEDVYGDCYYEGGPLECAECGRVMESCYGEVAD